MANFKQFFLKTVNDAKREAKKAKELAEKGETLTLKRVNIPGTLPGLHPSIEDLRILGRMDANLADNLRNEVSPETMANCCDWLARKIAGGFDEEWRFVHHAALENLSKLDKSDLKEICLKVYDRIVAENGLTKEWTEIVQQTLGISSSTLKIGPHVVTITSVQEEDGKGNLITDSLPGILFSEGPKSLIREGVCSPEAADKLEKANANYNMMKRNIKGAALLRRAERGQQLPTTFDEYLTLTWATARGTGFEYAPTREEMERLTADKKILRKEGFKRTSDYNDFKPYYDFIEKAEYPENRMNPETGEVTHEAGNIEGALLLLFNRLWNLIGDNGTAGALAAPDGEDRMRQIDAWIKYSRDAEGRLCGDYAIGELEKATHVDGIDTSVSNLYVFSNEQDTKTLAGAMGVCKNLMNAIWQKQKFNGLISYAFGGADDAFVQEYVNDMAYVAKMTGFADPLTLRKTEMVTKMQNHLNRFIGIALAREAYARASEIPGIKSANFNKIAILMEYFFMPYNKPQLLRAASAQIAKIKKGAKNYATGEEKGLYIGYLVNEVNPNKNYKVSGGAGDKRFINALKGATAPTNEIVEEVLTSLEETIVSLNH